MRPLYDPPRPETTPPSEQVHVTKALTSDRRLNIFSLLQPLHSDMSSAPSLFELQSSGSVEPLLETMGNPVEELREAVEMLNDTVRKRSRSQSHDQALQELMSKVVRISQFLLVEPASVVLDGLCQF